MGNVIIVFQFKILQGNHGLALPALTLTRLLISDEAQSKLNIS